jgi:hypothetical protein
MSFLGLAGPEWFYFWKFLQKVFTSSPNYLCWWIYWFHYIWWLFVRWWNFKFPIILAYTYSTHLLGVGIFARTWAYRPGTYPTLAQPGLHGVVPLNPQTNVLGSEVLLECQQAGPEISPTLYESKRPHWRNLSLGIMPPNEKLHATYIQQEH